MRVRRTSQLIAAAAGLGLAVTATAGPAEARNINTPKKLERAVTTEAVMDHLEEFQAIADANDDNRAAGSSGYEASGRYVEETLQEAGYETERQYFDFVYDRVDEFSLAEVSPQERDLEAVPMSYSPSTPEGGVTAELATPSGAATACEEADYEGADLSGQIALISRGTCSFAQKALTAGAVGAEGAIIYNNTDGDLNGTLGGPEPDAAPVVGTTQALGEDLLQELAQGPVEVSFNLQKTTEQRETFNVIAETEQGRDDNVVMLGAHLDGVEEGAAINDNGSGSAGILETAVQLAKSKKLNNKVRFAWWGAEELGLIGSTHYVEDLAANDPDALDDIATYLNFDMIGSPNYQIGVYDADESTYEAPVTVPEGSEATEDVFTDYFDKSGQAWVDTPFSGRSDYAAFIDNGVPASGLFTGADGVKTEEEVELFGGTAGVTYDPNYHSPADDLDNVNAEALGIMSDAIAWATMSLAQDTSAVNGERSAGKSGKPHPQGPLTMQGEEDAA
ncbi:M20/M25/M40 family metallo-hydrolase [Nocardioides panacisoli]|uniref:M20/M25/M40 family metallo-hydrolase n=1 Tax=Nocardioides panacisoli TaxID=627624 RepID=UPI001C639FD6|nr:M20/M25/M40 family metallo-hydrolase [Nocardioides panacisoli]QYJ04349.1 M20/M25/M40 family metallo-hydrolase [Nocardioides panacisoli]